MIQAFGIFVQHWMKDENAAKAQRWREGLRMRQLIACEHILLGRRIVTSLKIIVQDLMDIMDVEDDEDQQAFEELYELTYELGEDVVRNREIFGVCDLCNQGLVRFSQEGTDLLAVCGHCGEMHMQINNLF